jgi:hypothetical protein
MVGYPPLIAMIEPCFDLNECFKNVCVLSKCVSALKMEMGYVWKMSKELGGRDGCVCQEYG